jgi:hypothetical protein
MKIQRLGISEWSSYEPGYRPGAYKATIQYKGQNGEVSVQLTPDLTQKVLNVIAEELVAASREIANDLTKEIIQHAQLEAPKEIVNE